MSRTNPVAFKRDSIADPHGRVEGIGLGLRAAIAEELFARTPGELSSLRWLEIHPENYMRRAGRYPAMLEQARDRWPIVTHGLSMSLGGTDPLDRRYLDTLARFLDATDAPWHSDHLCFSIADGAATHDLLPLPMNSRSVQHVVARIITAQSALGVPLAVENVSTYVTPPGSDLDEAAWLSAIVQESGCALMLDVNNIYVNATNHGAAGASTTPLERAKQLIDRLPLDRVIQIHVAGHFWEASDDPEISPGFVIDTHSEPIVDDVYTLLAHTLQRTGKVPVLLERDDEFPPLDVLLAEVARLDAIWRAAPELLGERTAPRHDDQPGAR